MKYISQINLREPIELPTDIINFEFIHSIWLCVALLMYKEDIIHWSPSLHQMYFIYKPPKYNLKATLTEENLAALINKGYLKRKKVCRKARQ